MRTVIIFICSVLLSGYSVAQNNIANVGFEVDGKQSVYKDATVKFISNHDTINVNIEEGKLKIPESVFKKRVTVIFSIDSIITCVQFKNYLNCTFFLFLGF